MKERDIDVMCLREEDASTAEEWATMQETARSVDIAVAIEIIQEDIIILDLIPEVIIIGDIIQNHQMDQVHLQFCKQITEKKSDKNDSRSPSPRKEDKSNDKKSVSSEKNNITSVKDDNNKEEDKKDEPQV